jgi:hypothetical protein
VESITSSDSSVIWVPPSSQEMVPVSTQRSSGEGDYDQIFARLLLSQFRSHKPEDWGEGSHSDEEGGESVEKGLKVKSITMD